MTFSQQTHCYSSFLLLSRWCIAWKLVFDVKEKEIILRSCRIISEYFRGCSASEHIIWIINLTRIQPMSEFYMSTVFASHDHINGNYFCAKPFVKMLIQDVNWCVGLHLIEPFVIVNSVSLLPVCHISLYSYTTVNTRDNKDSDVTVVVKVTQTFLNADIRLWEQYFIHSAAVIQYMQHLIYSYTSCKYMPNVSKAELF